MAVDRWLDGMVTPGLAALLPHITAGLNALALCLMVAGFVFIRAGRRQSHRRAMLAAVATSALFLGCYILHHLTAPLFAFRGSGTVRSRYFALLISHVTLAVVVTPLVAVTLTRAVMGKFPAHPRIARWTLPIWLYVSVTGIVVYLMLYHLYV